MGDTGLLVLAAVEGFRSCAGDGWALIEADWMADAMSMAGFDIMGERTARSGLNVLAVLAQLIPYSCLIQRPSLGEVRLHLAYASAEISV